MGETNFAETNIALEVIGDTYLVAVFCTRISCDAEVRARGDTEEHAKENAALLWNNRPEEDRLQAIIAAQDDLIRQYDDGISTLCDYFTEGREPDASLLEHIQKLEQAGQRLALLRTQAASPPYHPSQGGTMKAREFKKEQLYIEQAPRCYLCLTYGEETSQCTANPTEGFKVKPNGICNAYTPGPKAKYNNHQSAIIKALEELLDVTNDLWSLDCDVVSDHEQHTRLSALHSEAEEKLRALKSVQAKI